MKILKCIALIAATALATPIAAAGGGDDMSHATAVHIATGFRFPPAVGGFNRVGLTAFNANATNINVSYASLTPGSQVAVTVYVMPALVPGNGGEASLCDQQFAAMDRRIRQTHPAAQQLVMGPVRSPSARFSGSGKQVIYDYDDVFYGQRQKLRSETDLYCYVNGNWLFAFRSTAPVSVDYAPKLAAFLRALDWPAQGSGKPIANAAPGGSKTVAAAAPVAPVTPVAPKPVAAPPVARTAPAVAPAVASEGNRVLVRLKAGRAQAALAGLVVTGADADLRRFETAASQRGVDARRMTENGKTESIASLLKPEIKLADASDLYRHVRDGQFGKVKLEVMLLPPGSSGDERDLLSRAAIIPASALETF